MIYFEKIKGNLSIFDDYFLPNTAIYYLKTMNCA